MSVMGSSPSSAMTRSDAWRRDLEESFGGLTPDLSHEDQAKGTIAAARLGEVLTFRVRGSPQVLRRTARAIHRFPTDPLKVCLQMRGRAIVHQLDHEVVVQPGQLALYDTGRPYDLRLDGDWECAVMAFPRSALTLSAANASRSMKRAHSAAAGPGSVLRSLITSSLQLPSAEAAGVAGLHLGQAGVELLMSVVSHDCHAAGDAPEASLRIRAVEYAQSHCKDPDLTHTAVAGALHISARSLDRLFEDEPMTITEVIRQARLDGAYRELLDVRSAHRTIAAVASHWCFSDGSHFNRAFKATYGLSPSVVRQTRTSRPALPRDTGEYEERAPRHRPSWRLSGRPDQAAAITG